MNMVKMLKGLEETDKQQIKTDGYQPEKAKHVENAKLPKTGSNVKPAISNAKYDYKTGTYTVECEGRKYLSKDGEHWEFDITDPVKDNDIIGHPNHYCKGRKYEPKDVIRDWGLNFNLGNAVKYISRNGRKDGNSALQDLKKARQYLDFEIDFLEKEGK